MATTIPQGFPVQANQGFPSDTSGSPLIDPDTGQISLVWLRFFIALWKRTGGSSGVSTGLASIIGLTGDVTLAQLIAAGLAPDNSPVFTGLPTAPTAAPHTDTAQLATTAFVVAEVAGTPVFDLGSEPVIPLFPTISPLVYSPTVNGAVIISGGNVTKITLQRGKPDPNATISDINLSQTTFPASPPLGTIVGSISVTSSGVGPITLSLSGQDAGDFAIVGTNLVTAATDPLGTYNIVLTATGAPLIVNGTAFDVGVTAGEFRMSSSDTLTVTFNTTPTVAVFFPS